MWWEEKIMRTFRCRLRQVPGTLGRLLSRLGEAGGDIGEIRVLRQVAGHVERDIVVFADSPAHMDRLVALAGGVADVELLEVRDDVLEMHQGGKIAIRSRYKIDSLEVLRRVGGVVKEVADKEIRIEGYTDNVPISSRLQQKFPTNWELSAARAVNVLRFLQERIGIPGERISACGFGEFKPVADNATAEGRALNRRIQIVLVPLETLEPPTTTP